MAMMTCAHARPFWANAVATPALGSIWLLGEKVLHRELMGGGQFQFPASIDVLDDRSGKIARNPLAVIAPP